MHFSNVIGIGLTGLICAFNVPAVMNWLEKATTFQAETHRERDRKKARPKRKLTTD